MEQIKLTNGLVIFAVKLYSYIKMTKSTTIELDEIAELAELTVGVVFSHLEDLQECGVISYNIIQNLAIISFKENPFDRIKFKNWNDFAKANNIEQNRLF